MFTDKPIDPEAINPWKRPQKSEALLHLERAQAKIAWRMNLKPKHEA